MTCKYVSVVLENGWKSDLKELKSDF
jgi:hypothetical protein